MTVEVGQTLTVVAGESCRMKIDGIQRASSVKSGRYLYPKKTFRKWYRFA